MIHPAPSHGGAIVRLSTRRKRKRRGAGQVRVFQDKRLMKRRAIRAGKRKLLSLCYFHIDFPHR